MDCRDVLGHGYYTTVYHCPATGDQRRSWRSGGHAAQPVVLTLHPIFLEGPWVGTQKKGKAHCFA